MFYDDIFYELSDEAKDMVDTGRGSWYNRAFRQDGYRLAGNQLKKAEGDLRLVFLKNRERS